MICDTTLNMSVYWSYISSKQHKKDCSVCPCGKVTNNSHLLKFRYVCVMNTASFVFVSLFWWWGIWWLLHHVKNYCTWNIKFQRAWCLLVPDSFCVPFRRSRALYIHVSKVRAPPPRFWSSSNSYFSSIGLGSTQFLPKTHWRRVYDPKT